MQKGLKTILAITTLSLILSGMFVLVSENPQFNKDPAEAHNGLFINALESGSGGDWEYNEYGFYGNIEWRFDEETGKLEIRGIEGTDGKMKENFQGTWKWQNDHLKNIISVDIFEGVTHIGRDAFNGCTNLISVSIPSTVLKIESGSFFNCKSLTEIVIPYGVEFIGPNTFQQCSKLKSVIIADSVTYIGDRSFYGCNELTELTLSKNLESIGVDAFRTCPLTTIEIPSSVTFIGKTAFYKPDSLGTVIIHGNAVEIEKNSGLLPFATTMNIFYKEGADGFDDPNWVELNPKAISAPGKVTDLVATCEGSEILLEWSPLNPNGEPMSYEIQYREEGNEVWNSYAVSTETELNFEIPNVEKGYDFCVTGTNFVGTYDGAIDPVKTKYTITFEDEDGTLINSFTQSYGTAITASIHTGKPGYTLDGWSPEIPEVMPAENMILTVVWKANEYTIIFDLNEGVLEGNESLLVNATFDEEFELPFENDPVRSGYYLAGFSFVKNGENLEFETFSEFWTSALDYVDENETITLYAVWEADDYIITFDTNEADGNAPLAITEKYGASIVLPDVGDMEKEGHAFAGWSESQDGAILESYNVPANNATLYAVWTVNEYDIVFETGEGSEVETETLDFGTEIEWSDYVTETEGYSFVWKLVIDDQVIDDTLYANMPAKNITVRAVWTVNEYDIVFETGEGSEVETETLDFGTEIEWSDYVTEMEGHSFVWKLVIDNQIIDDTLYANMPAKNITVRAVWEANDYSITFDTNEADGNAPSAITEKYGASIMLPDVGDMEKEGHAFAGWSESQDGAVLDSYVISAGDTTLYAVWTVNEYVISFNADGGTEVAQITQNYGTAVDAPEDPIKEGYTFMGWDPTIPETMPAGGLEITATWKANEYTISFDIEGIDSIEGTYGETVTIPDAPDRIGHTFKGWFIENDEVTNENIWNLVNLALNDVIVLTAVYEPIEYTISFDSTGGSEVSSIVQDYETPITVPDSPTKTGYVFVEWYPAIPETMPAGNLSVSAVWEPIVYDEAPSAEDISNIIENNAEPIIKIDAKIEEFVIENTIFDNIGTKVLVIDVVDDNGNTLYSWTFNGDYVDEAGTFKAKISEVEDIEEVDDLIKSSGITDSLILEFSASGILPMEALVKYYVGDKYDSGKVLSLFYFNEETNKLEDEGQELTVDDDGYVTFTLTHCSVYVIGTPGSFDDGWGSMTYIGMAVAATAAILVALFVVIRRRA